MYYMKELLWIATSELKSPESGGSQQVNPETEESEIKNHINGKDHPLLPYKSLFLIAIKERVSELQ